MESEDENKMILDLRYPAKIKDHRIKICIDCGSSQTIVSKNTIYCKNCHCLINFEEIE